MANSTNMRSLALLACYLFGSTVNAAGCNADNCLRALFPTQSPAIYSSGAAFCATFTASLDTRTTGYPSMASAACGTAAARYSSACSCKPKLTSTMSTSMRITPTVTMTPSTSSSTSSSSLSSSSFSTSSSSTSTSTSSTAPTTTCTPSSIFNDAVINGDFECGLPPWIPQDVSGTSHTISSPGDASTFAYEFDQVGPATPEANFNPASLSQGLNTVAGVPYYLTFQTYFAKCGTDVGFVGVMINRQSVYTVDACDKPAGQYNLNQAQFTAAGGDTLRFEFLIRETGAAVKIDNVSVTPLH